MRKKDQESKKNNKIRKISGATYISDVVFDQLLPLFDTVQFTAVSVFSTIRTALKSQFKHFNETKSHFFGEKKLGLGNWGVQYPHKLIRYCPPFMYCVFHHISDHLQRLILF